MTDPKPTARCEEGGGSFGWWTGFCITHDRQIVACMRERDAAIAALRAENERLRRGLVGIRDFAWGWSAKVYDAPPPTTVPPWVGDQAHREGFSAGMIHAGQMARRALNGDEE